MGGEYERSMWDGSSIRPQDACVIDYLREISSDMGELRASEYASAMVVQLRVDARSEVRGCVICWEGAHVLLSDATYTNHVVDGPFLPDVIGHDSKTLTSSAMGGTHTGDLSGRTSGRKTRRHDVPACTDVSIGTNL